MAELLSMIGGQPVGIAFGLVCLYFLNRSYTEAVKDKVEIIQIIRQERLEWIEDAREARRELISTIVTTSETSSRLESEVSSLRNRLTEWMQKNGKHGSDGRPN